MMERPRQAPKNERTLSRGRDGDGAMAEDPQALAGIVAPSPTAVSRLTAYVDLLKKWQSAKNLVSPGTLDVIWSRHVADSAQAQAALPEARRWLDIGSGAGLPGLVTAILLADMPGAHVDLVESNGRKAAFLRTVVRELGLPATIHAERIESAAERLAESGRIEAVSARALAPLAGLLELAAPVLRRGAVGVFHKGQDFASERAEATQSWGFDLVELQSKTDAGGRIVLLRNVVFKG
jgi:16S rRNA (guanine(527)-N(7))-methyltransferase GidB